MHLVLDKGYSFSGFERNCAFWNHRGQFEEISGISGADSILDGGPVAFGDFDNDGDPDLLFRPRPGGPNVLLYRNEVGSRQGFLRLALVGRKGPRDAAGAVVRVRTSAGTQTQVRALGSGFLSQWDGRLLFGLGDDEAAEWVEIAWPGGATERYPGARAGSSLRYVEGEPEPTLVEERRTPLGPDGPSDATGAALEATDRAGEAAVAVREPPADGAATGEGASTRYLAMEDRIAALGNTYQLGQQGAAKEVAPGRDPCRWFSAIFLPFCIEGRASASPAGSAPRRHDLTGAGVMECLGVGAAAANDDAIDGARVAIGRRPRWCQAPYWDGWGFERARDRFDGEHRDDRVANGTTASPAPGLAGVCEGVPAAHVSSCAQGVGRAAFFASEGDLPAALTRCAKAAAELTQGCVAGVGFAWVFPFVDALDVGYGAVDALPAAVRTAFLDGMDLAVAVRTSLDEHATERWMEVLDTAPREAVRRRVERALACLRAEWGRGGGFGDVYACAHEK